MIAPHHSNTSVEVPGRFGLRAANVSRCQEFIWDTGVVNKAYLRLIYDTGLVILQVHVDTTYLVSVWPTRACAANVQRRRKEPIGDTGFVNKAYLLHRSALPYANTPVAVPGRPGVFSADVTRCRKQVLFATPVS